MNKSFKVYIAGHNGMVGSALYRLLKQQGFKNILTKTHTELDLRNQEMVRHFIQKERPSYVILAAAKVGGIFANNEYPAEFIYDNLMIQSNVIHQSYQAGVKKLLFLGSSCIYPKSVKQPMREASLLTGTLEPTNEPYAMAKIAGIKLCESYNRQYGTDYRSVMPTNLYGVGDNFHSENSHVIPALIRRIHEAKIRNKKEVIIWGSGQARRDFLYVDDMASACVHLMSIDNHTYQQNVQPMLSHINIGTGNDCSIRELAEIIKDVVGFKGALVFDLSKPDGAVRKLLNIELLSKTGWKHRITLKNGLCKTYKWYLDMLGKEHLRQ